MAKYNVLLNDELVSVNMLHASKYSPSEASADVVAYDPLSYEDIYNYADGIYDGSTFDRAFEPNSGPNVSHDRSYNIGFPTFIPYAQMNKFLISNAYAEISSNWLKVGYPVSFVDVTLWSGSMCQITNAYVSSKQPAFIGTQNNKIYIAVRNINQQGSGENNGYWNGSSWQKTEYFFESSLDDTVLSVTDFTYDTKYKYVIYAYSNIGSTSIRTRVAFRPIKVNGEICLQVQFDDVSDRLHNMYESRYFSVPTSAAGYLYRARLPLFGMPDNFNA